MNNQEIREHQDTIFISRDFYCEQLDKAITPPSHLWDQLKIAALATPIAGFIANVIMNGWNFRLGVGPTIGIIIALLVTIGYYCLVIHLSKSLHKQMVAYKDDIQFWINSSHDIREMKRVVDEFKLFIKKQ